MNEVDRNLLDIIQDDLPLIREPYSEIASKLNISPDDVISRLKRLKEDGLIRRMGAIFDSKKLGYSSTLCAMKVPQSRIDEVARIVNAYQGVTHNYIRNHDYNMWFTITARSKQEIREIMAEIEEKSGIGELIELPATRMFKIRVRFPMTDSKSHTKSHKTQTGNESQSSKITLTEVHKSIIRESQGDIPLVYRPFDAMAERVGIEVDEFLTKMQDMKDHGVMRRFAAIVRHRRLGFNANAMVVWIAPDDRAEEIGTKMATFPQVSHCYQRPTRPGWPYNLFTMIHGESKGKCEETAELISENTGIKDYNLLYSTRELKKVSMKYFMEGD